ncbi:MAG: FAD-binding protein [Kangiellaceae bacterium]|nr:FAD-binding protein [Kangiellaceae bacterium]
MTILVIAEHNNQDLSVATLSTLAAAIEIGGDIHMLVMGSDCQSVADQAAACASVAKVLKADNADLEHPTAESLSAIVVANADGYSHILACSTTSGKNFMPRVGAKLDVQPISDITAVDNEDTFKRPIYAGNAIATVQSSDSVKVITVRGTGFDAADATGGSAEIAEIDASEMISANSSFVSQELTVSERPELTAASIIISGGRGMQSGDNFHLLESIADKLGAAVGASRAAVDAGFVPNDYQVGQTGKIVAPDLYIAVGISGAIQHLAGMKDSKVIVAINKDEEAPIFQVSDYGLVADLFKALPELNDAL